MIHLMKAETSTGNPPYSSRSYSIRCAASGSIEDDRGEALTAGQIATASRSGCGIALRHEIFADRPIGPPGPSSLAA